jgi:hypothetical protein
MQWSYFKGLLLRNHGRISGCYPERAYQTLKIRPSAIKPIDIVWRGSVVTWFYIARLLKMPLVVTIPLCLYPANHSLVSKKRHPYDIPTLRLYEES